MSTCLSFWRIGNQHLPCRINEPDSILVKGAVHGIQDGKFTQSLNRTHHHRTDTDEADELPPVSSASHVTETQQTNDPGPPVRKAPPVPTKRPAPIDPPSSSVSLRITPTRRNSPIAIICMCRPWSFRDNCLALTSVFEISASAFSGRCRISFSVPAGDFASESDMMDGRS